MKEIEIKAFLFLFFIEQAYVIIINKPNSQLLLTHYLGRKEVFEVVVVF